MDPRQCLLDAEAMLREEYIHAVHEHLWEYWQWRGKGGFEPVVNGWFGDRFASDIMRRAIDIGGANSESN